MLHGRARRRYCYSACVEGTVAALLLALLCRVDTNMSLWLIPCSALVDEGAGTQKKIETSRAARARRMSVTPCLLT